MAARKKATAKTPSVDKILAERQKTHGDFLDHSTLVDKLKTACRKHTLSGTAAGPAYDHLHPSHKEALDMIMHKAARIISGNPYEKDHWDDIAGYATLASKACEA